MFEIIYALIFLVPAFVAMNLLKSYGMNDSESANTVSLLSKGALYWFPSAISSLLIYEFLFRLLINNYTSLNLLSIVNLNNLEIMFYNLYFLIYFVLSSSLISYFLVKYTYRQLKRFYYALINKDRKKDNLNELSSFNTNWSNYFSDVEAQIVKIHRIGDPNNFVCGAVANYADLHNDPKTLILKDTSWWTDIFNEYEVQTVKAYIDLNNGVEIHTFRLEHANALHDEKVSSLNYNG